MIKRHSILTAILLCFVAFTQVMAQEMQEPEPLPIDPKVRYGKLSNGLTYYIRHNDQPKDRADFYIAQNVGSILEEENQRGLAHFLEHMAFDGRRNFPNNGMDEYIESVGMRSGLLQKMVSSGLASDYHRGRRKCRSSGGNDQKDVRRCPCPGQPGKTGTSIGSRQ